MSDRYLGNTFAAVDQKAQYDTQAKLILADSQFLAWILKFVTTEFRDLPVEDIVPLIGERHVEMVCVEQGLTMHVMGPVPGFAQESAIPGEGKLLYDIRFDAFPPETTTSSTLTTTEVRRKRKHIHTRLLIDVEAQKDWYPGYDLTTRGIVYAARMLSEQLQLVTDTNDYDRVEYLIGLNTI